MNIVFDYSKIRDRLYNHKRETGKTYQQICKEAGISNGQVSNAIAGKETLGKEALAKLSIVMGCKIDDLIDYKREE